MPKNDNAHSIRVVASLKNIVGDNEASEFEKIYPLSKAANIDKN